MDLKKYLSFSRLLQTIGLSKKVLLKKALKSGWVARKAQKIEPEELLGAIYEGSQKGSPSYNDIASILDANNEQGDGPSKQAVAKRMNDKCLDNFKLILQQAFDHKLTPTELPSELFRHYKRVLVQDSTIIKLPKSLYDEFSGVSNGSSKVCNCRIQVVYDVKNKVFIDFSIDPYSKNDLTAAPELELQEADLVLRDRGYLSKDEIERHIQAKADCIDRHKAGTNYLDAKTEEPIDLLKLLKEKGSIDQTVMLNNKEKTLVRIVGAAVDPEIATERKRKAKKESRSKTPSRATLALMSWTIFITTIRKEKCDFKTLFAIYALRWRIEIIFKAWKSNLKFAEIHPVSKTQLMIILTARLLRILVFTNCLYRICYPIVLQFHDRHLSLSKFLKDLDTNPDRVEEIFECLLGCQLDKHAKVWDRLKRYCCYDKRTRLNYHQMYECAA